MTTKTSYRAEFSTGLVLRRKSVKSFSHAWLAWNPEHPEPQGAAVWGFARTADLAVRAANSCGGHWRSMKTEIVPVTID